MELDRSAVQTARQPVAGRRSDPGSLSGDGAVHGLVSSIGFSLVLDPNPLALPTGEGPFLRCPSPCLHGGHRPPRPTYRRPRADAVLVGDATWTALAAALARLLSAPVGGLRSQPRSLSRP